MVIITNCSNSCIEGNSKEIGIVGMHTMEGGYDLGGRQYTNM
jgi:dissimilatory sulfite reductase (desulfoviridin) alpha/beta subunit